LKGDKKMKEITFTAFEKKILTLKIEGLKNREIGKILNISPHTVKALLNSALRKFQL